jgi:citrate lyase beta subunit
MSASQVRRRSVLAVPGSEPAKILKAGASAADEVVVDLEDAVAVEAKDRARGNVPQLAARAAGALSVRVNAPSTQWHTDDLVACARNSAVTSVVLPKVESAAQVLEASGVLEAEERRLGRGQVGIQALIESPAALSNVTAIAASSPRLVSLVIGYADLSASLGRRLSASWQFAQDLVLLAARTAGIQAIDGPQLTVADDAALNAAVESASALGFDGKWVIHPRQVASVQAAFSPRPDELEHAQEVLLVMDQAARDGAGAVSWRGRMLDEALVVAARRVVARADGA